MELLVESGAGKAKDNYDLLIGVLDNCYKLLVF